MKTEEKYESEFQSVPEGIYVWQVGEEVRMFRNDDNKSYSHAIPLIVDKVIDGDGFEGQRGSWFINLITKAGDKNKGADDNYAMLISGLGLMPAVTKEFGDDANVAEEEWASWVQANLPGKFFQAKHEVTDFGLKFISTEKIGGNKEVVKEEEKGTDKEPWD